ncbi:hypothetical protein [Paenibacillus sp. FSL H8-0034]
MDRRSVDHIPRKFIPMKLDILFKMVFGSKVEVEEIINNELAKEQSQYV